MSDRFFQVLLWYKKLPLFFEIKIIGVPTNGDLMKVPKAVMPTNEATPSFKYTPLNKIRGVLKHIFQ